MNRFICIHGHFYQPPRENPWLEEVELQDSAYPYHDWNERIAAECYAPNAASRILDHDRRIIGIVNNYSKISFNFGPTLLAWLERHNPQVYQAILEADKKSRETFSGHGAALAQVYNHMIMPLANSRDKRTQIIWGISDFRRRFNRDPEGMWLAEAAVDLETLELLAEQNIKFAILAPSQAQRLRKIGEEEWQDVSGGRIDPQRPYRCNLASGRNIAVFFYDGPVSREVAFGGLLESGEDFARKLLTAFPEGNNDQQTRLVHIATDGETYGHHHRFGDMALAYCLYYLESNNLAKITIYGEYLENNPPQHEAEIFENSSWSCFHGIERWRSNCGCNSGMHQGWTQGWRAPLRGAMDWLRDNLIHIYEEHAAALLADPWKARDEYVGVILDRSEDSLKHFLSQHAARELSGEEEIKALELLEMQRHAMLMFTSCGWFFDEISGIETVQIIQYAARAIQLARLVSGVPLEETYRNLLERAPSNVPEFINGAKIYEMFVQPAVLDLRRVGIHYGISSIFTDYAEHAQLYTCYVDRLAYERDVVGKQKLAVGRILLKSRITWRIEEVSFAVLHIGDHNLVGGARVFRGEESFLNTHQQIREAFLKGDMSETILLIESSFKEHSVSLWYLFKDEQRKVLNQIFDSARKEVEVSFRNIYEHYHALMQFAEGVRVPLPQYFYTLLKFVLNTDIWNELEAEGFNIEKLRKLSRECKRWKVEVDRAAAGLAASRKITASMERFARDAMNLALMADIIEFLGLLEGFSLSLDLWQAQNIYFSLGKQLLEEMQKKSDDGQEEAKKWLGCFQAMGDRLKVRVV